MFNALKIKNECVEWIRDFFKNNGPDCNAVIGISGGKDSSVAAALCVEALGKDRVIGVLMPKGEQADIDCSLKLVNHLGIKYFTVNIGETVEALKSALPNDIEITSLVNKVKNNNIKEVIIAISPTLEGETTALYISKLLESTNVLVSKIAYGIPMGADMEYLDPMTLSMALNNRNKIS